MGDDSAIVAVVLKRCFNRLAKSALYCRMQSAMAEHIDQFYRCILLRRGLMRLRRMVWTRKAEIADRLRTVSAQDEVCLH